MTNVCNHICVTEILINKEIAGNIYMFLCNTQTMVDVIEQATLTQQQ